MIYCVEDERNIRELLVYTLLPRDLRLRGWKMVHSYLKNWVM